MPIFRHFRFWCQSVLPLVYDDSLSYYEVLCKVVEYINNLIDTDKELFEDIDALKNEIMIIQNWIDNYDTEFAGKIIEEYIGTMVLFGLTDNGYFVAYTPDSWDDITFKTTGWDYTDSSMPEYGHLCLIY